MRAAARSVVVRSPYSTAAGEHALRWGTELDARPLRTADTAPGLADDAVAAYVAKYVTKGAADTAAGTAAGTDHRLLTCDDITAVPTTPHIRALMRTCWHLGGLPEYEPLRLRSWAHTLGYRGHILTKSRTYSTTYAALRAERANHQHAGLQLPDTPDAITDTHWRYLGTGHTPGAALIAAGIAQDITRNRESAREDLEAVGGGAL